MICAVMMVKDEADIIGDTVNHLLTQVDHVIVSDNGSTDGTVEILEALPVQLLHDPEVAYRQAQKMSHLALLAARKGAAWVIPVDADEIWVAQEGTLKEYLCSLLPSQVICSAPMYDHVTTDTDPATSSHVQRMGWRKKKAYHLLKVACRPVLPVSIAQGNHSADYGAQTWAGGLTVHHFPCRSPEQFLRKVVNGYNALAHTPELPSHSGQHWRDYHRILADEGVEALNEEYRRLYYRPNPENNPTLIYDPAPLGSANRSD